MKRDPDMPELLAVLAGLAVIALFFLLQAVHWWLNTGRQP